MHGAPRRSPCMCHALCRVAIQALQVAYPSVKVRATPRQQRGRTTAGPGLLALAHAPAAAQRLPLPPVTASATAAPTATRTRLPAPPHPQLFIYVREGVSAAQLQQHAADHFNIVLPQPFEVG